MPVQSSACSAQYAHVTHTASLVSTFESANIDRLRAALWTLVSQQLTHTKVSQLVKDMLDLV